MSKRFVFLILVFLILVFLLFFAYQQALALQSSGVKKILVLVEGNSDLRNYAMGDGRQLATLLGHFETQTTVKGINSASPNEVKEYDYFFYIGFHARNPVPSRTLDEILNSGKPFIWLNTGFAEYSSLPSIKKKLGFSVTHLDSTSVFDVVRFGSTTFTKGEPNLNVIEIRDRNKAGIVATAFSTRRKRELPYIVTSGNLTYFADSPFASATESDRYLLFADMLHDILHEQHAESHSALIRIEDVSPMDNPDQLREIADILSTRGVPFLVGVIPFFVDPGQGVRVSMSDKPDLVDALKYMVRNGGTLVMHGVTHQYKGVTTTDYEFWDERTNKPIKGETPEGISKKLDQGIQELMKNGLFPLLWETPHYTASFTLYQTVSKFFSSAIEQRLAIEDADYSQYFPYVIKKDLFGQTIYPENLGYVPLDPDFKTSEAYVATIIKNAKVNLYVRDGFASCFFHAFLNLDLLKELVDGIQQAGYTYIDLKEQTQWVHAKDRVILAGSQDYSVTLQDQYLLETYYERNGEPFRRTISESRFMGQVSRHIELEPGQFYKAEPTEFRERQVSFLENLVRTADRWMSGSSPLESDWKEAHFAVLWNHFAKGAAYNDQSSFASVFRSVNLDVDTLFLGQPLALAPHNIVVVPYAFIDSLKPTDYEVLTGFVESGGNLITDAKNDLAEEFGVHFSSVQTRVRSIRDRFFPEERISWQYPDLAYKLDVEEKDEVFCLNDATDAPLVIGRQYGKGKLIVFGTSFDPYSQHGYSRYPYLLEYVRQYFKLGPVVRRDDLEMYFDPGFRHTYSIEQLIKQWVNLGIRRIHVAGWHQYPKYTYDYERLIRLAHANGILVYAWLEPPQVSQKFWMEHPEWREKNFKGEDARPSWRYPVALTDAKCLDEMANKYRAFLQQYDWDGVNLAELYFEAGNGFETPQLFTPMHPSARREFRKIYGYELTSIFSPGSPTYWKSNSQVRSQVTEFRVSKLKEAYQVFLDVCAELSRQKEGFEIIVTAMDSYGTPELRENFGVDMSQILKLQQKWNFLLQVEDPESKWSTDPFRYVEIGKRYEELLGDRAKLLLDLNILSLRKKEIVTPFPTLQQTGTESFQLINAAAQGAPRFTVYAESSVNPQDLIFFSYAAANDVSYDSHGGTYTVNAPRSFVLKPSKDIKQIRLDGAVVSTTQRNIFLIPAGAHEIEWATGPANAFSTSQLETHILSSTGNLLSVSYAMRRVTFEYESEMRTLISFSSEPFAARVDGQEYPVAAMKGNDCYSMFFPPGRHSVEVTTGGSFSYGINVTSLWSTTVIAIFGVLAVSLLLLLYIGLKVIKKKQESFARSNV